MSRRGGTKTRHHLYPKSRGEYIGKNTQDIDKVLHYAWHTAFDDEVPEEVLQDFLDIWWPDENYTVVVYIGYTERIFQRRCQRVPNTTNAPSGFEIVFPNNRPLEILKLWLWRWVPDDYFDRVTFFAGDCICHIDPYNVDDDLLAKVESQRKILLNKAYRRWRSVGHWERKEAYTEFLTRL